MESIKQLAWSHHMDSIEPLHFILVIQDQSLSLLDQLNLKRNFKHAWLGMDEL
jgi:hypothetical protein